MEPYLGEIRAFAFNSIPRGWLPCNGQTLQVQSNAALFSLLGTFYGGNGTTTFQLPNLQGRTMMSIAQNVPIGLSAGTEAVTLTINTIPPHTHQLNAQTEAGSFGLSNNPPFELIAAKSSITTDNINNYINTPTQLTALAPVSLAATGASAAHPNMPPFLVVNLCIATQGIYPSRN